ncbi:MAG: hypothetical protein WBX37_02220 [Pseudolabrys sp.]
MVDGYHFGDRRRANICAAVIAFEVADCSDWPEQAGADFVILSSLKNNSFQLACKRLETFLCRRPRYARNIEWRDGYAEAPCAAGLVRRPKH